MVNKIPWKISIILIAIVGLVSAGIIIPVVIYQQNPSLLGIEINSDEDFSQYNLPGSGTQNDPYIIENFCIKPTNKLNGILISDVSKFFVIRNCIIESPDEDPGAYRGINIKNLDDGIARISNNTLLNCETGIYIFNAEDVIVSDNYIYKSSYVGINVVEESNHCIIQNNLCEYSGIGIRVYDAPSTVIKNNVCSFSNYSGISMFVSGYSHISDNTLTNSGFELYLEDLEYSLSMNFENNTINGKYFGFLTNLTNQTLTSDGFGQLYLLNCSNMILEDLEIRDTSIALTLFYCNNCTIRNSIFTDNTIISINLRHSNDILSFNNTCTDNMSYHVSSGIFSTSPCGIHIYKSTFVTIQNCKIQRNGHNGIYIFAGDNCSIAYNRIEENRAHGLFLWYSYFNDIHHNAFIDNGLSFFTDSQGFEDDGFENYWYNTNTNQGNFWNDWIVGYYFIEGFNEYTNTDKYPLTLPPVR